MSERHIVALGGGGFSSEVTGSSLDAFILGLARRPNPRICFLPTASGDSDTYVASFYRAFSPAECRPSDLALFRRTVEDLRSFLLEQDVIYVGGGNTANMLVIWRRHGVDTILRECWEAGVVLAGISAGAICWFEAAVTDSFGLQLAALNDGLGFLPGSACPHYDSEERQRPLYQRLVEEGFPGGSAADEGVGLHFTGTLLKETVSSRPDGRAYELKLESDRVNERTIAPRLLG
ncbi:MAG TPA: peptidase E [Candidatus Dormibacteraeota bacterium]|nr:peptidase E [Candidatus Dormibacteraeota bacterium]